MIRSRLRRHRLRRLQHRAVDAQRRPLRKLLPRLLRQSQLEKERREKRQWPERLPLRPRRLSQKHKRKQRPRLRRNRSLHRNQRRQFPSQHTIPRRSRPKKPRPRSQHRSPQKRKVKSGKQRRAVANPSKKVNKSVEITRADFFSTNQVIPLANSACASPATQEIPVEAYVF